MKEKTCFVSALKGYAHFLSPKYCLKFTPIVSLILSLATSCSAAGNTATRTGAPPAAPTGYVVNVTLDGNPVAALSLDALGKLEQTTARNQEHDSTGPTLTAVLKLAGITDFNEVKIGGVNRGRVATAELTLKKSQLTDRTIMDVTNRGTVKFTDAVVPFESWIFDVTDLDVN